MAYALGRRSGEPLGSKFTQTLMDNGPPKKIVSGPEIFAAALAAPRFNSGQAEPKAKRASIRAQ